MVANAPVVAVPDAGCATLVSASGRSSCWQFQASGFHYSCNSALRLTMMKSKKTKMTKVTRRKILMMLITATMLRTTIARALSGLCRTCVLRISSSFLLVRFRASFLFQ